VRVLVIGSEGFIGRTLVRRLRSGAPFGPKGEPAGMLTRLDLRFGSSETAGPSDSERCVAGDICERAVLERAVAALPHSALPPQRSFLLPVQRLSMDEVVRGIAGRYGPEVLTRVNYRPDAALQRQFANYPPLRSPRAEAAGFRHDRDVGTLIRRAMQDE
jgi:hypothetical protein